MIKEAIVVETGSYTDFRIILPVGSPSASTSSALMRGVISIVVDSAAYPSTLESKGVSVVVGRAVFRKHAEARLRIAVEPGSE